MLILSFFFFQAEDGIRDGHVTGVQTCALPISLILGTPLVAAVLYVMDHAPQLWPIWAWVIRSEERRVGKECRYRGTLEYYNKKILSAMREGRGSCYKAGI